MAQTPPSSFGSAQPTDKLETPTPLHWGLLMREFLLLPFWDFLGVYQGLGVEAAESREEVC